MGEGVIQGTTRPYLARNENTIGEFYTAHDKFYTNGDIRYPRGAFEAVPDAVWRAAGDVLIISPG
jgi:hypothetical protein